MKEINLKEISIKAINYLTALPKEEREPMALGFTLALAFYLLHPGAPLPGEGGFSRHKDLLSPAPLEELRRRAWEAAWEAFMATGHEELLILPSLFHGKEGPPLLPPEEAQALFVDGFVGGEGIVVNGRLDLYKTVLDNSLLPKYLVGGVEVASRR